MIYNRLIESIMSVINVEELTTLQEREIENLLSEAAWHDRDLSWNSGYAVGYKHGAMEHVGDYGIIAETGRKKQRSNYLVG